MTDKAIDTKIDYCPTRTGNMLAYMPEFLDGTEWVIIPTKEIPFPDSSQIGIPPERYFGGLYTHLGLFSYAQAMAIAWSYAARIAATEGEYNTPKVRARPYDFIYDLKARKWDEEEIKNEATIQN